LTPTEFAVLKGQEVQPPHDGQNLIQMKAATKMFIRARESVVSKLRGQTMTEYALILAAIAAVVYGAYAAMGNNIGSLANGIDSSLTNA
jgi:Flp pilus assembly pilin Flp